MGLELNQQEELLVDFKRQALHLDKKQIQNFIMVHLGLNLVILALQEMQQQLVEVIHLHYMLEDKSLLTQLKLNHGTDRHGQR